MAAYWTECYPNLLKYPIPLSNQLFSLPLLQFTLAEISMILFQRSSRGMIARTPRFSHFSMLECCGMIIPINTLKTENTAVGGYYTLSV
jgi:hypothetical protein